MSSNSKIGKTYYNDKYLSAVPDAKILVEAATRRGQPLSELITPSSPRQNKIDLQRWKLAEMAAKNVDNPDMNPMYEIYDNITIDLLLSADMEQRILNIQQSKFNLVDDNKKPDEEAKKLLQKQWFLDLGRYAMESKFEHYRLIEMFDFDENGELVRIKCVNKYHVQSKKGFVVKEQGDEKPLLKYLEDPQGVYYMPIGNSEDLGLLFKVAPVVFALKYALGHWGEYNEKIGIPFRSVTSNAADSKRQQQLAVIMQNMGSAGWAVLNENEKVELLATAAGDPTKCFQQLIMLLDSRIATYLLGQSSTTSSDKNKGTYGSLEILQDISKMIFAADKTFIEFLYNDVLLKRLPILSPAYKVFEGLKFEWDLSVDLSVQEVVDYVVKLSDVFDIDSEWVTQKTGIPIIGRKSITPTGLPPKKEPLPAKKKSPVDSLRIGAYYEVACCSGEVSAVKLPSFTDDFLKVAKLIFDGKQKGVLDEQLLKNTAKELLNAVLSGYKPVTDDSSLLDVNMLKSLKENVYAFSGFKTYETLRVVTDLLTDDKGIVRTWPEFKKEVLKVDSRYNKTYLRAEYDNAVVSSSQASQWMDIQNTKDVLPWLKFVATLDDRTTDICRGLDGIELPADDPFWLEYFLPLHWKERSLIQQLATGTATDMSKIILPQLQPMFKQNVGISGEAFPDTHPYFDISEANKKKVMKEVNKYMPDDL